MRSTTSSNRPTHQRQSQSIGSVPPPQTQTQSRPEQSSRFYLPSPTALSRHSSRHLDRTSSISLSASASASVPTSPRSYPGIRRHLRSRSSLAALRAALHDYQIPPETDHYRDNRHGAESSSGNGIGSGSEEMVSDLELDSHYNPTTSDGNEMMDALVDIHRVLYRGRENMDEIDMDGDWDVEEIRRVIERWFEGDCSESFSSSLPLLSLSLVVSSPSLGEPRLLP